MNDHAAAPLIVRRDSHSRFETEIEGLLSVIDYRIQGQQMLLPSVRVPPALEGRGIAAALTRAALDWAREESMTVVPICPYVVTWLKRHPEFNDLLVPPPAGQP